ncbi:MAG: hydantoin utilization protein [Acidiferrobacteraceae bacterium]|jgi:N-methylhydantoinase A|nr:hydantoin utilization protein [Acidiferrobacteraceae bacterium]MDP6398798.1 hydantoinase/oxoprolinase family protein [Arenicellales bacterium]MDP6551188.1 hydantoinase/oxoprolinase family protein [Arenicellales bacterium]MDP6918988.1 hydantoinase/oxoprolinase family protein [Arenicellales bacterium]|tara:strand:- start:17575 stop:19584 length:2010 start_codon:yes stop_codon:yes gene_type:complete
MKSTWSVGIDIGGTFTDIVAVDSATGETRMGKVLSRPDDPVAGITSACHSLGLELENVGDIMHGTTMATNAIVENRLQPTALVITEGFADTLEIGRQNRRELYRLSVTPRVAALVPPDRRVEARERIDAEGVTVTPLTDEEIKRLTAEVEKLGVESLAISLLHSYVNGEHESRLADSLRDSVPYIALSHELNPEPREYERTNSTAMNAALMPLVARYLARMKTVMESSTGLHLFHSAGGMASVEAIQTRPLALALSGPAAGVTAGAEVAGDIALDNVITFDMGGTTTDVSIIADGEVPISSNQRMAGYPVRQMMVAVETIGAGGGSIARRDGKAIRVGPDSAGASPGPACYGQGGTQPTVADANAILGYIDPDRDLGGSVRLDIERAERAFKPLADAFGKTIPETALGVRRVANANMARALRRVTIEHGADARTCTLLAFGGAGPMHAVSLAREFGIETVVVPRFSSAFSALGCITAEMRYAEQRPVHMPSASWDADGLGEIVDRMRYRLAEPLLGAKVGEGDLRTEVVGLVRYSGQSDTVSVMLRQPYQAETLNAEFRKLHDRLYGFSTDEPWELDTVRVTVKAPPAYELSSLGQAGTSQRLDKLTTRECWFEGHGKLETPFYDRSKLPLGVQIDGPMIIQDDWSTIVVEPGTEASVDGSGQIFIRVR